MPSIRALVLFATLCQIAFAAELGRLHPKFEGVYRIRLKCSTCKRLPPVDRAVLADMGKLGVRVSLHDSQVNIARYVLRANRIDDGGTHVEADGFFGHPGTAEWISDIDPRTGELTARLRDGALGEVEITGKIERSPADLYQPQAVSDQLSLLELQGKFEIKRGNWDSYLHIRPSLSGNPPLVAMYMIQVGTGVRIDFSETEFFPEQGVLLLYSSDKWGVLKWTISVRRSGRGLAGEIHALSTVNGGWYRTTLKR